MSSCFFVFILPDCLVDEYNASMEIIQKNVRDLNNDERHLFENALGHELTQDQQIIIQVVTPNSHSEQPQNGSCQKDTTELPEWCNVYAGLTDDEADELENVILQRSNLTRPSD